MAGRVGGFAGEKEGFVDGPRQDIAGAFGADGVHDDADVVLRGDRMAKKKSGRKPSAAFMKPMQPSQALSEVVGDKAVPRTEVTKRLWAYIKRNNLQDKKERRNINADDALREVFGGKKTVSMFEMTKLVNNNLS